MKTIEQVQEYINANPIASKDVGSMVAYLTSKGITGDITISITNYATKLEDFKEWFEEVENTHPLTYDECLRKHDNKQLFYITSIGVCYNRFDRRSDITSYSHNAEIAKAIIALNQLIFICNEWNKIDNFTPTFGGNICNHAVMLHGNKWGTYTLLSDNQIFSFKTAATAEKFLESQKDLLEQVKPLFHC